eukprot:6933078-Pyramimonas_sp.AAC.1
MARDRGGAGCVQSARGYEFRHASATRTSIATSCTHCTRYREPAQSFRGRRGVVGLGHDAQPLPQQRPVMGRRGG